MSQAALPVLKAPRLELRPLKETDAEAITDGVGNFNVSRWLGAVPYPYDKADARSYIAAVTEEHQPVWGIVVGGKVVGMISLHERLGYWLARSSWRKGYAYEACVAALEHWFESTSFDEVEAGFFRDNERSESLLRALGFRTVAHGETFAKSLSQWVSSTDLVLTRGQWTARKTFTVYSPRLTLRALTADDVDDVLRFGAAEIARNVWSISADWTRDAAREFIRDSRWTGFADFRLAVEFESRVAGYVGFGGSPASVYFALVPEVWGQGVATEALSAFLPEVFDRFPVSRIHANHFEDNPASGAVLRKFGFQTLGAGMATSKARLEPAPVITYAVTRETLWVPA